MPPGVCYFIVTKTKGEKKMKNMIQTTRTMIIAIVIAVIALFAAAVEANAETEEYTKYAEAGKAVLEGIENHESEITVNFKSDSRNGNKIADKIFNNGVNQSEIVDYIKYGLYTNLSTTWTGRFDGEYHFEITYKLTYKITKNESNKFEKKLAKTVKNMKLNGKSNKAKIKKIYNWITKNVKYDKKSKGIKKFTAYAALMNKKAVCQGYAVLFYRMCEEAGVDSKVITGKSYGENHAWNIAKVGKKYYNLDSTWDAGKKAKNYKYFLKGNKNFKNHKRNSQYSSSTFYNAFPMAK